MKFHIDNKDPMLRDKKHKRCLVYVSVLFIVMVFVSAFLYVVIHKNSNLERAEAQYKKLFSAQEQVNAELSTIGSDLIYFSHSDLATATLSSQDQVPHDYLKSLMFKISSYQKRYDQIRLLDTQGNEIIRIDQRSDLSSQQVPTSKLQNKKERYYFKETLKLKSEQIFVSRFELNKERGEVEYPIKPTIRFATPTYSIHGQLLGVGIINYNANHILQIIKNINNHKGEQTFLINSTGYYLESNKSEKNWGFMFPKEKQHLFSEESPRVWKEMQGKESGFAVNENGEYYFRKLNLNQLFATVNNKYTYLITHVPKKDIYNEWIILMKELIVGFLLLFSVLAALVWKLAGSQVKEELLFKKLIFEARHDALTGLYNRATAIDFLNKNISICRRRKSTLALAFIDVNDLKKTNDRQGHLVGDELLKGVATAITQTIRETDFSARLGGDEFIIIFVDCNQNYTNEIMARIQSKLSSLGLEKTGCKWSFSYGVAELLGLQDNTEKMIERADNAMYKHKAQISLDKETTSIADLA
tara:strand:- start:18336 stop:19922 length:1587 start_codon:yes stop_codon:yes gene_type:complete